MAHALQRDLQAGKVITPESLAYRLLQTNENSQRRRRRRVATGDAAVERGTRRGTDHMLGALSESLHFSIAGAQVGGGDIAPAQAFDEVAHGLEQCRAFA